MELKLKVIMPMYKGRRSQRINSQNREGFRNYIYISKQRRNNKTYPMCEMDVKDFKEVIDID